MSNTEVRNELVLSTLDKGLRVLEAVAAQELGEGYTLTELSPIVGIHRSTLFRILSTLQLRGYVRRDRDTDRYSLGLSSLYVASSLLKKLDLREVARPFLRTLANQTQELIHLVVLDESSVVTIDRVEGKHPLSLQTQVGERRPAYCTASGKAMLAYMRDDEVEAILSTGMPIITQRTITSRELMHGHLSEVRRRGYAWDDEERVEGVRCVAAAVLGHSGDVVGAISIAAPAVRTPLDRLWLLGKEVRNSADEISLRLGYQVTSNEANSRTNGDGSRNSGSELPE